MSIGKRITEAIDKMASEDAEAALSPTCQVISATAKKEFPSESDNIAFKTFIHENFSLITNIAFDGRIIENLRVGYNHPDIINDADGSCSFEQILYHVIRCGFAHKAGFASSIKFIKENRIKVNDNLVELPEALIYGLLAAVIVSPKNKNESVPDNYGFNFYGWNVPIKKIWGNKQKLIDILKRIKEINKMDEKKALEIIQPLINGVDPETGEFFPDGSPYRKPEIIKSLSIAGDTLKKALEKKLRQKKLPKRAGKPWSDTESEKLVKRFDKGIKIKEIASQHQRTTGSIRSQLTKLGKIQ